MSHWKEIKIEMNLNLLKLLYIFTKEKSKHNHSGKYLMEQTTLATYGDGLIVARLVVADDPPVRVLGRVSQV